MGFIGLTNYKKSSERLKDKHHLKFINNKNLVEIKIDQLLNAGAEHIYISTDDTEVKSTDKITFIGRDDKFCNNVTNFSDVLKEIFNSYPVSNDKDVIFTFTCCPLFNRYKEMYDRYLKNRSNQIAVYPS